MGWAVGDHEGRHIGYGVPAKCDHPGCTEDIDRGLSHRCGDLTDEGCNRFFCTDHLDHFVELDEGIHAGGGVWVCERCEAGEQPFEPTPDTPEWTNHILTDESWQQWRDENPERVAALQST